MVGHMVCDTWLENSHVSRLCKVRGSESGGGNQFGGGKEREKGEKGEKEGERRKGRRGRRLTVSSSDLRRSDSQNSLDQIVKSIYATRAILQEVGILHTLVYFPPQGLCGGDFSLRGYLAKFWNERMLPDFDHAHWTNFGIGFLLGK